MRRDCTPRKRALRSKWSCSWSKSTLINITTGGSGPPRTPLAHMAIQTQKPMKQTHGHLKNYTAVARATTSRVLGGGWPGWWLHPRRPRNAVVDHVSTSPCGRAPSPTATAGTCQAALPRPSVLPGAALIACANKTHTVKGDGVAEACAVRTHTACTLTLLPD